MGRRPLDEWRADEEGRRTDVMPQSWKESVGAPGAAVLERGPAVHIDVETFEYTYSCKHCGHRWSEERDARIEEKLGTPTD